MSLILLTASSLPPAPQPKLPEINSGFAQRAYQHILHLASLGNRVTGTEGEAKAIEYVRKAMEEMGLTVTVEPFEFDSFTLASATLKLDQAGYPIERLGFDPYPGARNFPGDAVFVDPAELSEWEQYRQLDLAEKIAVSSIEGNLSRMMLKESKLAVQLSSEDFAKARAAGQSSVRIVTTGAESRLRSANVIGLLSPGPPATDEVILSAHLDSWSGPGACDNASGVGVLLELVRHLSSIRRQLRFRVKFIAFGGEELGLMGSKAYLHRHLADLTRCRLLFNMDTVGGHEMHVEMRDGVRNVPGPLKNRIPEGLLDKAPHDLNGNWILNRPDSLPPDASNVPEWLQAAITAAAGELGYEFTAARDMGSDHRIFTQAGVVSTNIAFGGSKTHSPEDIPGQVNIESLEKTARMVLGVLERVPASD